MTIRESKLEYPTDPTDLFRWIILQLGSSNGNVVDIALQLLQSLLSIEGYRQAFFDTEGAIPS
jgi:hypothetical protein